MFGVIMPLCNRMYCCIFGQYFFIEIRLKYEKKMLLFHCLPLWKTVLFVSSRAFSLSTSVDNSEAIWKKATKCNKILFLIFFQHCWQHKHFESPSEDWICQWAFGVDWRRRDEPGFRLFASRNWEWISPLQIQFRQRRRRRNLQWHQDWWREMASAKGH